jgi:hypothetical protein
MTQIRIRTKKKKKTKKKQKKKKKVFFQTELVKEYAILTLVLKMNINFIKKITYFKNICLHELIFYYPRYIYIYIHNSKERGKWGIYLLLS